MNDALILLGRIGLALPFVLSGVSKIGGYTGTQQYMESTGVPGMLLPLVILLEVGGGLAIAAGFLTRWVAFAFVLFAFATALLCHNSADPIQSIMFMKNVTIAGGFLVLAAAGAGAFSVDAWLARRRTPAIASSGRG